MAPIIDVSKEVLEHLRGLNVPYKLIESPKPVNSLELPIDYQINPSDFILLEGKNSGKDSYPDLLICKYRLRADSAVESLGRNLGITVKNIAQEKNKREYVGGINREQALKLNLLLGGRTLNTRQAKDFFELLLSGKAFDGSGGQIIPSKLSQIANEIFGVRTPYRAEWFEDYFTGKQGDLILNKNYVLEAGEFVSEYSYNLTSCLMENRTPGINFKSWLKNSTEQGFPGKNTKSGKLWYWPPRANRAVGFNAYPDYADLVCDGNPQYADAGLGVRHVREAHAKS